MPVILDLFEYANDGVAQAAYVSSNKLTTEVLYVNGVGSQTNILSQVPGSGAHWDKCSSDNDSTYVKEDHDDACDGTLYRDLYAVANSGVGVGIITNVSYVCRLFVITGGFAFQYTSLKTHGVVYDNGFDDLSNSTWTNCSKSYNTNPNTGAAWTWAEINALEIGPYIRGCNLKYAYCSRAYIVVTYQKPLESYSESTIKTQGSYSLEALARAASSLNETLTKTIGSPINISGEILWKFDIRSSRTGSHIRIGLRDAGGVTTEHTANIAEVNVWQTEEINISGIAGADRDAINSIIITIVNADADNTFYVDNMYTVGVFGDAVISGGGSLISSGIKGGIGDAVISGGGSRGIGDAVISGGGSLISSGIKGGIGDAVISGGGSLISSGIKGGIGDADISGNGVLTVTGTKMEYDFVFTEDLISKFDYIENIDEIRNLIVVEGEEYTLLDELYRILGGSEIMYTLDDIPDGAAYGRVALTSITAGKIIVAGLDAAVTNRMFISPAAKENIEAWRHAGDVTLIDGGDIYTGSIVANSIAVNAIEADKIKAGAVTTIKLDALAVTAAKIAASAITTVKLNALAVTAAKIAVNAIEADKIKAGAVTTDKLDALSITAGKIAVDAIETDKLKANSVTAGKINVTTLSAISANVGILTAGKIYVGVLIGLNGTVYASADEIQAAAYRALKYISSDGIYEGTLLGDTTAYKYGGTKYKLTSEQIDATKHYLCFYTDDPGGGGGSGDEPAHGDPDPA